MRTLSMRFILVCIVLMGMSLTTLSSTTSKQGAKKYWITFRDKGIPREVFKQGIPLYEQTLASLSTRALKRRRKSSPDLITIDDAPLFAPYVDSLRSLGLKPIATSKWLNAVSAMLDARQLQLASSLTFVTSIEPVAQAATNEYRSEEPSVFLHSSNVDMIQQPQALPIPCGYDSIIYHYGLTGWQLARIGVPPLHAMGFDASGVHIGFFDTGFNPEGMRTTKDRNIVRQYDFVFRDSNVTDDANDPWPADGHGSVVLSAAVGYLPDSIVSPAYNATIYLGKTEDLRSETPAEEDNYAEALEWLEALGGDIASSSLGYLGFDSGFVSHTYQDLDGRTTIAARAAVMAARKGMLVVTAAGNNGAGTIPYTLTPGDADSIIAAGALLENDSLAGFSARGPTYDGRLKPEICAPGAGVMTMNRYDVIQPAGGTSLATPLVSSACALIMQAHPEASAQAVRKAIMKTGTRFGPPDTAYGYGRLNAYAAALELGAIIAPHREWRSEDSIHHICVALAANNTIISPRIVYAIGDSGKFIATVPLILAEDSLIYHATFPPLRRGKLVRYYIETRDGADTVTRSPRDAPLAFYKFYVGDTVIIDSPLAVRDPDITQAVQVYPNPASDKFTVVSSYSELITYKLIDIAGKELLHFETTAHTQRAEVRFGALSPGVYFLHGQLADGTTVIGEKIVKLQ